MIKNYIVYNKDTGKILRTGSCPESMISIQTSEPNEEVIEGKADDILEKVVGGRVVSKSPEEIAAEKVIIEIDPTEQFIQQKMYQLLRKMAIEKLKEEGKIE